uniref:Unconventional myosin-XIX n=1 Tax=Scleropages formosus TaxID=113540 RepID=A0A8C9VDJ3_SCLFO
MSLDCGRKPEQTRGEHRLSRDRAHVLLRHPGPVRTQCFLKCLQARYSAKVFYTHAGCTLVALNPFQPIPHLYSLDVMKEYHCAPQPQEFKPHIFIVAEEAYRNVQGQVEPTNQSLVVSGESGAGKTWTSRCLMKYYATIAAPSSSQKCQDTVERIERRVLDSNPIMEAFGNASTLRNNNSSRFGKYIQLQLDRCVPFMLLSENSVVVLFEIILLTMTRVLLACLFIHSFVFLYPSIHSFIAVCCSGHSCWLEHPFKLIVFLFLASGHDQILAGLLNLGNVIFCPSDDESQPCKLKEQSRGKPNTADLLGVPSEELEACLRLRSLRAGKQSVVLKPCSQAECSVRRDCLAKLIYAHVFDWLVACINKSMCADTSRWCNFIGLLDVYGFECFTSNNLEQLCINYANEKLQQHFVAHYLKAQQEDYVSEGLAWSFIQYQDNQSCLDLIEGSPAGVFSLLNEECRLNRPSDAKQFRMRLEKELSSNACVSWDKFSRQPDFTVLHYAGKVSYQIEGMMEKNKDPVPPELVHLLQQSQDSLLQSFFTEHSTEDSSGRGPSKVVTVVSKFKNSLESLMKILHSTTPHYTRCIKPNPDCRPLTFKKEEVINQLEACGIVETINISAAGFPIRVHLHSAAIYIFISAVRLWLVRREVLRWRRAATVIQRCWRKWKVSEILESPFALSTCQEPVMVRSWPLGLALASAPTITVAVTACGFQKVVSLMTCLKLSFRSTDYKVETNQFDQGVASIRAQPQESIKLHLQRSPLLYADMYPGRKTGGITGFNQILLEKT